MSAQPAENALKTLGNAPILFIWAAIRRTRVQYRFEDEVWLSRGMPDGPSAVADSEGGARGAPPPPV